MVPIVIYMVAAKLLGNPFIKEIFMATLKIMASFLKIALLYHKWNNLYDEFLMGNLYVTEENTLENIG